MSLTLLLLSYGPRKEEVEGWNHGELQLRAVSMIPVFHHSNVRTGGPGRSHTRDLRVRSAALCLLSYGAKW